MEQIAMHSFVQDASTPYWWISVVVVGIVIHIVGTLITRRVEDGSGKASNWWRARTKAQIERRQKTVERLLADPHEETLLILSTISDMVTLCLFLLFILLFEPYSRAINHVHPLIILVARVAIVFTLLAFAVLLIKLKQIGILLQDTRMARRKRRNNVKNGDQR